VLKAPNDPTLGRSYATLLVQSGNYEGGIAALERLLLDPQAPVSVRVDLAILYYRLGSYVMAEGLLRQAMADGRITPELMRQVQNLLPDVARRNQVSQWDGLLMLGVRSQTNPMARAHHDWVYSGGKLDVLPKEYQPKSGVDVQALLRLDHRYDLGHQNEAAVVSSLLAQVVNFTSSSGSQLQVNQVKPYDLHVAELTSGVRLKPMPTEMPRVSMRPYVTLTDLAAQGHSYLHGRGAGVEMEYRADERTLLSVGYDHRRYRYAKRIDVPDAAVMGGPDSGVRVYLSRELGPGHVLSGEIKVRKHDTARPQYNHNSVETRMTYAASYISPIEGMAGYWSTSVWAGVVRRNYGGPDVAVHPTVSRKDTEWRLGVAHSMPLSHGLSLLLQLEHVRGDANLPNFQNKNTSVFGALSYRF
jgi:hypothetical protein